MKSKKIRSLFCAAALTLSLAACGSKTSDYSGQTITGEITDIDGTAVTMQLGELSAGGMPSHDVSDSSDSGQTPPDKLDGETQSGNSSSEDHASSDSSQPPAKPDSQSGDSGSQPPEKPDGEAPSGSAPGGMGGSSFTAGEESVRSTSQMRKLQKMTRASSSATSPRAISCSTAIPSRWPTARC